MLYYHRPFNIRYAVWEHYGRYAPELLRTHRTATASWLYIHRRHGIDDVGPTPNWAVRTDLVLAGRSAPQRATDPALDGLALWMQADAYARAFRPDEPVLAHAVGSLPHAGDPASWRNLVEGFCEDHLVSQGMAVDWAVHAEPARNGKPEILPHAHLLITMRAYDRKHVDVGRVRQNWLRTEGARKRLTEKWWAHTGLFPRIDGQPFSS